LSDLGRDGWQANIRRPVGLSEGAHTVRVRGHETQWSNSATIFIGAVEEQDGGALETAPDQTPSIYELENSMTETTVFHGYRHEYLSCRFFFPGRQLRRQDVRVVVDGHESQPYAFSKVGDGKWQTNSWLPKDLQPGEYLVAIRVLNGATGNRLPIQVE